MYDFDRKILEAIFEGDGDMGSQAKLEEVNGKQKRIGGDVNMRKGDPLKARHPAFDLSVVTETMLNC